MNDKLYKVLRIIFLALAIFSLVFTLAHKVGLCASGGGTTSYYPFESDRPLAVAGDVGSSVLSDTIINTILTDLENGNYPGYPFNEHGFGVDEINLLVFREYNSSGNYVCFYAYNDGYIDSFTWPADYNTSSNFCNFKSSSNYFLYFEYDFDTSSITYITSRNGNCWLTFQPLGNGRCWIESTPSNSYAIKTNFDITDYPVYLRDGSLSYNGVVRFQNLTPSGGGSSSEGLDDVIDMIDQIEDNSDVPQIDDTDPADISNPIGFLRKILTGIKKLGTYIISGFSSMINAIKNAAAAIVQAIVDFYDFVRNNFYGLMQSFAQAFNNLLSSLPTWIGNVVTAVQNIYNWLYNVLDTTLGGLIAKIVQIVSYLHDLHTAILDFIRNFFHGNNNNFVLTDILNGILGLPASIYSYFSSFVTGFFTNLLDTLNDWLEDSEDHLPDWLNELKRIIHNIYTMGIDPEDSDHRFSLVYLLTNLFDFNTSQAITAFRNNKYGGFIITSKNWFSDFITAITGVQPSERVFFTINLGTVFGNVDSPIPPIEIDFNWYAQIRDTFLPVFCAFLYVTVLWLFIKRLPDIIRGVAGAESSFMDGLPDNEFAPTSGGFFTTGVSHNQPSLDKSPLSGSGGVHSGASQFWY